MHTYKHQTSAARVGPAATTLSLDGRAPRRRQDDRGPRARQVAPRTRLTPDAAPSLFGESLTADGKRDVLEGRLITMALRTLRLGTSVVLDFGLWGRDERSALRWLAEQAGVPCQVVYLPVELSVQLACIAHRQAKTPNGTFPMPQAAVVLWRNQFQAPDAAELAGEEIPCPSPGWSTWLAWAVDRWPTLDPHAT